MKIILVHTHYRERGGEDEVFQAECAMLRRSGHDVALFEMSNHDLEGMGRLQSGYLMIWNAPARAKLEAMALSVRPDIVHFHNTFPLMSPSVFYAAKATGAAVVQTVHNYRMSCVAGVLFRDGAPCNDCLGHFALGSIIHRCFRGSVAASAAVASMQAVHRGLGTWRRMVDLHIAPTRFVADKLVAAGIAADRIAVKAHFTEALSFTGAPREDTALFVGRLSQEKGVRTLLKAWRQGLPNVGLTIIGDGPLAGEVAQAAQANNAIRWRGRLSLAETRGYIARARVLVVPSDCYETFGRTVIEGFSAATPVLVSGHGAIGELVRDGETGRHFRPGDSADLVRKLTEMLADPAAMERFAKAAHECFARDFSENGNCARLIECYSTAMAKRAALAQS